MKAAGLVVLVLAALVGGAFLVAWIAGWDMQGGWDDTRAPQLIGLVTIGTIIASGALLGRRGSFGQIGAAIIFWGGAFLLAMLAYTYRGELATVWARLKSEIVTSAPVSSGAGEVQFRRAGDSHFYVDSKVNGGAITFMVDTGATQVALSWDDARAAGFDPETLDFWQRVNTASGTAMVAPVRLERVEIAGIVRTNLPAAVLPRGAEGSLLGLAFLNTLQSYEISGDRLTLRD